MTMPLVPIAFLITYIVLRIGLDPFFWRNVSPYAAYGFEIFFVAVAAWTYRQRLKLVHICPTQIICDFGISLVLGFSVHKLAVYALLPIPFDLQSNETILLLLIVAPPLEELIFRMALWEPLKDLIKRDSRVLIGTTILFSIGHLQALWFVPESLRSYVLYQALYVILLGLGAGWRRLETGTITTPILVHFSFNLGFFLAGRF